MNAWQRLWYCAFRLLHFCPELPSPIKVCHSWPKRSSTSNYKYIELRQQRRKCKHCYGFPALVSPREQLLSLSTGRSVCARPVSLRPTVILNHNFALSQPPPLQLFHRRLLPSLHTLLLWHRFNHQYFQRASDSSSAAFQPRLLRPLSYPSFTQPEKHWRRGESTMSLVEEFRSRNFSEYLLVCSMLLISI